MMRTKKQIKEAIGRRRHKHNLRKKRKHSTESIMYEDMFGIVQYNPNRMAMVRIQTKRKTAKEKLAQKRAYRKLVKDRRMKKGGGER